MREEIERRDRQVKELEEQVQDRAIVVIVVLVRELIVINVKEPGLTSQSHHPDPNWSIQMDWPRHFMYLNNCENHFPFMIKTTLLSQKNE